MMGGFYTVGKYEAISYYNKGESGGIPLKYYK